MSSWWWGIVWMGGSLNFIIYATVSDTLVPHLNPLTHPPASGTVYLHLHLLLGNAFDFRDWLCSRTTSSMDRCVQRLADARMQSPSTVPYSHLPQCVTTLKSQSSSRPRMLFVSGWSEASFTIFTITWSAISLCPILPSSPAYRCVFWDHSLNKPSAYDSVSQKLNVEEYLWYFQEGQSASHQYSV